jgi:hypothetical protein
MTTTEISELWKKASPIQPRDFLVCDMINAEKQLKDNAYQYIGVLLEEIKNLKEDIANRPDDDQVEIEFIKKYEATDGRAIRDSQTKREDLTS